MNCPFVSFYFDCLFALETWSLRKIERFWGFVFRPWKNMKIILSYFFPKKDESLVYVYAKVSANPMGEVCWASSDRLFIKHSMFLISIEEMFNVIWEFIKIIILKSMWNESVIIWK